jgi:hypothetical protein
VRTRRLPADIARALAGFAGAVGLLVVITALRAPGLTAWADFADNIARHARAPMANLIGATSAVSTLLVAGGLVTEAATLGTIVRATLLVATVAATIAVARAAPGRPPEVAAVFGMLLVFAALNLNAYYYAFLVFATVIARDRPLLLAGAFAVEAASYALALAEGSTAVLYAHRSLLVGALLAALVRRGERGRGAAEASAA